MTLPARKYSDEDCLMSRPTSAETRKERRKCEGDRKEAGSADGQQAAAGEAREKPRSLVAVRRRENVRLVYWFDELLAICKHLSVFFIDQKLRQPYTGCFILWARSIARTQTLCDWEGEGSLDFSHLHYSVNHIPQNTSIAHKDFPAIQSRSTILLSSTSFKV